MAGNMMFPVICFAVLSISVQLIVAQPPPHFMLGPPRPSPRSWGRPNEISGGGLTFRPPPGLLVAGFGPPVSRPSGPVRHGGRPPLSFPLVTSTSVPMPSVWPSHGPQIQRAQENSHFEYEVLPRFPKPPTHFRVAPSRHLPRPIPSQKPTNGPPGMFRMRDAIVTSTANPRLQSRSSSPPPPFVVTSPPYSRPPYATPSDADFQEGFRVLNDLFREDAGADIRHNLVGGSDVSFSGGYFPALNNSSRSNSASQQPKEQRSPSSQFEITPANEQGILIAGSPPKNEDTSSSEELKASSSDHDTLSYGPPQYQPGPPQSHVSFMFSDPHEPRGTHNLYNNDGYEQAPPPPFHTVGNSILPPLLSRQPQEGRGSAETQPQTQQNGPPQSEGGGYKNGPPQSEGGYKNGPPQSEGGYKNGPQQSEGGYKNGPQQSEGGYKNGPQQSEGGYNSAPPPNGNSLQSSAPTNAPIPMPMMMMPLGKQPTGNEPLPTSDEVQKALGILARYASKQAQSMGMSASPQMMMQMQQGMAKSDYGAPQQQQEQVSSPSSTYGSPFPQQVTPVTNFLSRDVTAPPVPSTMSNSGSSSYSATTEVSDDAITISDSSDSPESSFSSYGAPQSGGGNQGGYSSGGSMSGGSQGGYSSGGSMSGGSQGGYSSGGSMSGGSQGGYSSGGSENSQGGYSSGGGWGSGGSGGAGGGGPADLIGAKVNALKTIGSAVTGGIKQVGALKAGILNAGLNVLGGLGRAKGDLANSLKIPIMPKQQPQMYGPPSTSTDTTSTTQSTQYGAPMQSTQYGPPMQSTQYGAPQGGAGWGSQGGGDAGAAGLLSSLVNAGRGVVGGIAGTVAAGGKAAVGIGVSKNEFVKNHFVIKGHAFTDLVSKQVSNKNEYFQNVIKHIASIFDAAGKKPSGGWSR